MARLNRSAYVPDGLDEVELLIGPVGSYTDDQLRTAWEALRDQVMNSRTPRLKRWSASLGLLALRAR